MDLSKKQKAKVDKLVGLYLSLPTPARSYALGKLVSIQAKEDNDKQMTIET